MIALSTKRWCLEKDHHNCAINGAIRVCQERCGLRLNLPTNDGVIDATTLPSAPEMRWCFAGDAAPASRSGAWKTVLSAIGAERLLFGSRVYLQMRWCFASGDAAPASRSGAWKTLTANSRCEGFWVLPPTCW